MAELPEIYILSQQMKTELVGRTISGIDIIQPKCLNVTPEVFKKTLFQAQILDITYHGKWIFIKITGGWLLLCLGMGGEILLVNRETLPKKRRVVFDFTDKFCLAVNFWWFGYIHFVDQLHNHKMTVNLGINAFDLDANTLRGLLKGKRGILKSFLLDQGRIAGIGNFYIHDILFQSRLHPLRTIQTMTDEEIDALAYSIYDRLQLSINKGGFSYEVDLYGKNGNFNMNDLVVGYKENQPCPVCGTPIQKIKTGSTHSYLCHNCQK